MPLRAGPGGLVVAHGEPVQAERIVSLPRLVGPWIGGLPHDGQGFLATDAHGAVLGVEAVWAAGDGTAFPLKQGGLAAQQAGAAAAAIAALARRRRAPGALPSRAARDAARSRRPRASWTPRAATSRRRRCGGRRRRSPHRTSASYLAPHAPDVAADADPEEIDVGELLLGLAERHATLGEDALALRCLDAAAQVRGGLPPDAAARRDELAGAHAAS